MLPWCVLKTIVSNQMVHFQLKHEISLLDCCLKLMDKYVVYMILMTLNRCPQKNIPSIIVGDGLPESVVASRLLVVNNMAKLHVMPKPCGGKHNYFCLSFVGSFVLLIDMHVIIFTSQVICYVNPRCTNSGHVPWLQRGVPLRFHSYF